MGHLNESQQDEVSHLRGLVAQQKAEIEQLKEQFESLKFSYTAARGGILDQKDMLAENAATIAELEFEVETLKGFRNSAINLLAKYQLVAVTTDEVAAP